MPAILAHAQAGCQLDTLPAGRYTISMKRFGIAFGAVCVLAFCITGIVLLVRYQQQMRLVRQFIAAGPANVAREELAARQAGVPLDPARRQQPLPQPSQNAALVYATLTKLLHDQPLHLPKYAEGMDALHSYTPAQVADVRKILASRQDVITLVHQAVDKPQCVFKRDWKQGIRLEFPEYREQREAARLLKTESYLLARDGRYQEAIANQARGFRVAQHAASDHVIIAYLVGVASESISLSGMQSIMAQAGPNAVVDNTVKAVVASRHSHISLRDAMAGETGLDYTNFTNMHRYEQYGIEAALNYGFPDDADGGNPPKQQFRPVSVSEQAHTHDMIDAWQADYLHQMLPLVLAGDAPVATRRSIYAAAGRQTAPSTNLLTLPTQSIHTVSRLVIPVFSKIDENDTRIHARESVTLAAAAILGAKAKTGAFPDKLPQEFLDPYTNKPLQYRREGETGFVVYAVGPTGHFDGGQPGQKTPGAESLFRYPAVPLPPN